MQRNLKNLGAPDPDLRNSPILDTEEEETLDAELEAGTCYFNGIPYSIGAYVLSGDEVLHCVDRGVWIRQGEIEP